MNKRIILLSAITLSIAVIVTYFIISSVPTGPERLSAEQISKIREKYPVITPEFIQTVSILPGTRSYDSYYTESSGLLYVEILDDGVNSSFPEPVPESEVGRELYEKAKKFGDDGTIKIYAHKARVIDSSNGDYAKGQQIIIYRRTRFFSIKPLKKGERIITLYDSSVDPEGMVGYFTSAYYYVTSDGYVISSYDEQEAYDYNGLRVDIAFDQMKGDRLEAVNRANSE